MSRRRILARGAAIALAAVLTAGIGGSLPARASGSTPPKNTIEVLPESDTPPTYMPGEKQSFRLFIKNTADDAIEDFEIKPDLQKDDASKWPFKTESQKYSRKIERIEGKATADKDSVIYTFTERDDVPSKRYTIYFEYTYKNAAGEEVEGKYSFYVYTTAKSEDKKDNTQKIEIIDNRNKGDNNTAKPEEPEEGGVSNGEPSYSGGGDGGGGEGGDGSVPRVIVTGFDTEPKEVKAGTDFVLKVHLKNTSRKTRVKNMLFDLNAPEDGGDEQTTAPAFLPSSGSSSIYLEGMKANGTADIAIKLNAKSDLLQKPYSVELSMKYEDSSGGAVEAASSLSIPIKQDARFEFSDFEINPESFSVDDEANVMCNLYNLGRVKLYNVKATFEGNCIEKEEVFVGNVESGATASIDAMLKGTKASQGPEPVTMTMSYENEEGEVTSETKELMLEVTEVSEAGMEEGMMPLEEEKSGGFPLVPIVIAIGLIAVIAAVVIILKERKKRLRKSQEEEFLYELDGSSEDEQ